MSNYLLLSIIISQQCLSILANGLWTGVAFSSDWAPRLISDALNLGQKCYQWQKKMSTEKSRWSHYSKQKLALFKNKWDFCIIACYKMGLFSQICHLFIYTMGLFLKCLAVVMKYLYRDLWKHEINWIL